MRRTLASKLNYYHKNRTAYIEQYFRHISEIEKYQQSLWAEYRHISEIEKYQQSLWAEYHMYPDKPRIRKECIAELHQLTITLANLYEILPAITLPVANDELPVTSSLNRLNRARLSTHPCNTCVQSQSEELESDTDTDTTDTDTMLAGD